jgi:hypothetical protein
VPPTKAKNRRSLQLSLSAGTPPITALGLDDVVPSSSTCNRHSGVLSPSTLISV